MAQPTSNPYRTYNIGLDQNHWTDSLPWHNVVNIQSYASSTVKIVQPTGVVVTDWLNAYNNARNFLASTGGGVVYFPALPARTDFFHLGEDSAYYFSDDLLLANNVSLRGQDLPASSSALQHNFKPGTWFNFPEYDYLSGVGIPPLPGNGNRGGTFDSTAFKKVRAFSGSVSNVAIVNIDFNGAGILATPDFTSQTVPSVLNPNQTVTTNWASSNMRNWLVLGCRFNNVIELEPSVPTASQAPWQRYMWRFSSAINLYVKANGIVANNRINDADSNTTMGRPITVQSFVQSQYQVGNSTPISSVVFDYHFGYGIILNSLKRSRISDWIFSGFVTNSSPAQEPELFAPGNVVEGNWVFHKTRIGISASGAKLLVKNNVIRDTELKETSLSPMGTNSNNNTVATFENRGIQVSGWGAVVEDNDIQVYRIKFPNIGPNYYSADGEGFYSNSQGAASINGLTFKYNRVKTHVQGLLNTLSAGQNKGFSGVVNQQIALESVNILDNDMGGSPIYVVGYKTADHVEIRNNTKVHSITVMSPQGGALGFVTHNSVDTTIPNDQLSRKLTYPCNIWLNNDFPASTNQSPNLNTGFTLVNVNCPPITSSICNGSFPNVNFLNPMRDTIIVNGGTGTMALTVQTTGSCSADSVVIYQNGLRIDTAALISSNQMGDIYNHNISLPVHNTTNYYTFRAYTGGQATLHSVSPQRVVGTQQVVTSSTRPLQSKDIELYPNPAKGIANLRLTQTSALPLQVSMHDLLGRSLMNATIPAEQSQFQFSLAGAKPGIYLLRISNGSQQAVKRLQVQ